ncbi:KOW motif-containing protein [Candidatus Bipolaricaulota bacterium]|nr:KOW motif-containing protein [Candidatus Bipolaricaulota bacterium]MBS3814132.1 KOW motif-containing protein [Candidatus Bipolaricaulota bacterium]
MKKWYAIQTYAGSELKVKKEIERRIESRGLENKVESFKENGKREYCVVPIEEVITSRSRRGKSNEYRIPYSYDLLVESNERLSRGDSIGRKKPKHLDWDCVVTEVEPLQRVIVEMTNRTEETYLIPTDKRIRRDIRKGEKIRSGVPLTSDKEEKFVVSVKGKIALRDKVKRIEFMLEDGSEKEMIVPERCLVRLKEGDEFEEGDKIEQEDVIKSRSSGMVKVKEYKDKRVVTVQPVEKRRLFPGYVFVKMDLPEEEMIDLVDDIRGAVRFVGSRYHPIPIRGKEMKVVKRLAGMIEAPTAPSTPRIEVDFDVGEVVEIVEGPFADFTGEITAIDKEAEEVTVNVKIFGRETPVDIGFEGIEKI